MFATAVSYPWGALSFVGVISKSDRSVFYFRHGPLYFKLFCPVAIIGTCSPMASGQSAASPANVKSLLRDVVIFPDPGVSDESTFHVPVQTIQSFPFKAVRFSWFHSWLTQFPNRCCCSCCDRNRMVWHQPSTRFIFVLVVVVEFLCPPPSTKRFHEACLEILQVSEGTCPTAATALQLFSELQRHLNLFRSQFYIDDGRSPSFAIRIFVRALPLFRRAGFMRASLFADLLDRPRKSLRTSAERVSVSCCFHSRSCLVA